MGRSNIAVPSIYKEVHDLGNENFVDYNYFQNESFRENYDELQRSLRCCSFIESDATDK